MPQRKQRQMQKGLTLRRGEREETLSTAWRKQNLLTQSAQRKAGELDCGGAYFFWLALCWGGSVVADHTLVDG